MDPEGTEFAEQFLTFFRQSRIRLWRKGGILFMKIKEFDPTIRPLLQSGKPKAERAQGLDFQKLLTEASQRLNGAKPIDLTESASILSQCFRAGENTLTTLEQYQEGLASPETPLKKIDPIIQTLIQEVNELALLSERLSPADPLRNILDEIGILSAVEIEKFQRGEYV